MLTALHPELLPAIRDFPAGLLALPRPSLDDRPILVVKVMKEGILAARLNRNVKVYLPSSDKNTAVSGLVTAFFDDADEPLVLRSPLFDDGHSSELLAQLSAPELDVHLFDEHARELLAFRAKVSVPAITRLRLRTVSLQSFSYARAGHVLNEMYEWFARRSAADDAEAITISFEEPLMPEDIYLLDATLDNNGFVGAPAVSTAHLVREQPGLLQEHDIALSLRRVFPAIQIFKNPLRINDREEIADLLVISDTSLLFVQAKDSPNTESVLRNSIERKMATARKNLKKALGQTRGAIRYARSAEPMVFFIGARRIQVPVAHHKWRALIVVKELFSIDWRFYSDATLKLGREIGIPCVALDYAELNMYTSNLREEYQFVAALERVFKDGDRTGMLPRLRVGPHGAF